MAEIYVGNHGYGNWYLGCERIAFSQSIENNQTYVTYLLYLRNDNGNANISFSNRDAWIHDSHFAITASHGGGKHELGRRSFTVNHDAQGNGALAFGWGISTSYVVNGSSTYYETFPQIPRASAIGTVNFTNFWSNFSTTYTKYYSGYTCKLRVSIPQVKALQTFENYGSGQSVSFSSDVQNDIMDRLLSGSIKLGFVIETWSGTTKIGESSEKVIDVAKPTINAINSINDFDVEGSYKIGITKYCPFYTSYIEVYLNGTQITTANIGHDTSYTVKFTTSELAKIFELMKTVNRASFTTYVTSFRYNSNQGNSGAIRTGYINNATPTFGGFDWSTINNLELHDNKTIVKGYSTIRTILQEAKACKGATISYYQVACGNVTNKVTTLTADLAKVDSNVITVYAVDTRGNAISKQMVCDKFINYAPIIMKSLEYERSNSGIGSDVTIKFDGTIFIGDFGKQSNTIETTYYYKEGSATEYIQGTTNITPTLNESYKNELKIRGDLGANGFTIYKNFNLKVIVKDKLSNQTREIVISKGTPTMAIDETGVGFGAFYDKNVGGAIQSTDIAVGGNKVSGVLGFKWSLGEGVDLNTLIQEGYYHQKSTSDAQSGSNYPAPIAGLLTVINRGYIYQTYQLHNNEGFYYRSKYNNTWYPWKKVISGDKDVTAHMTTRGGYLGFDDATGGYLRTPLSGLIPYERGTGTGYVGTPSWQFLAGYFKTLFVDGASVNKTLSTTEQFTGDYWVDGRKIYMKTFYVQATQSIAKAIIHGISNIGDYRTVDSANSYLASGTTRFCIPRVSNTAPNQNVEPNINAAGIIINAGTDARFDYGYITIRYTKN